jgi:response regulator RpfG family c-di-GMP phosphodiesterase
MGLSAGGEVLEMDGAENFQGWVRQPEIMIVDDQSTNCHLLAEISRGFCPEAHIEVFNDPLTALNRAREREIDLVLTDYRMPQMNGVALIRMMRRIPHLQESPIICVTAIDDLQIRYEALDAGANDYLSRPLDYRECAARCRNLLNMRRYQLATLRHARMLEQRVEDVVADLQRKKLETLTRLAKVAEQRDTDTGAHLGRIGRYSALLARRLGLDEGYATMLEVASPLHDIGKVAIPDSILMARRALTDSEWQVMRTHTVIGHAMLSGGDSEPLMVAAEIARSHHERFDGSGYPDGLVGEEIPVSARILSVVDVFDALTSKRPYKEAWDEEAAKDYLREQAGKHLDPNMVKVFLADPHGIEQVRRTFQ